MALLRALLWERWLAGWELLMAAQWGQPGCSRWAKQWQLWGLLMGWG